jgi:hypothetical protein
MKHVQKFAGAVYARLPLTAVTVKFAMTPSNETPRTHITRSKFLRTSVTGIGAVALAGAVPSVFAQTGQATSETVPPTPSKASPVAIDLREFVQWIRETFEPSVRLAGGAGSYARKPGDTVAELYGVADMACVLYAIRALNLSEQERVEWAKSFQQFQTGPNGMLVEKSATHAPLHNTAFALAAMELLNLAPAHPVSLGNEYANIRAFLLSLDWKKGVYSDSHKGAGIGAAFALVPELRRKDWFDEYFATCDGLIDPRNGLMGQDKPANGDADQIGGSFHYAFLYSHFNRFMAFPERRIDAVLGLQQSDGYWSPDNHLWMTLDALYLLTRTARQTPHRFNEIVAVVRRVMTILQKDVYSVEGRKASFSGKMPVHSLTAAITIAAEAQIFLGNREVITDEPLRNILDRRPFI